MIRSASELSCLYVHSACAPQRAELVKLCSRAASASRGCLAGSRRRSTSATTSWCPRPSLQTSMSSVCSCTRCSTTSITRSCSGCGPLSLSGYAFFLRLLTLELPVRARTRAAQCLYWRVCCIGLTRRGCRLTRRGCKSARQARCLPPCHTRPEACVLQEYFKESL